MKTKRICLNARREADAHLRVKTLARFLALSLASLTGLGLYAQTVAIHDPWLNWDLINYGPNAYDFQVVVETPNWQPPESFNDQFDTLTISTQDFDGDGDLDTVVHWSSSQGLFVPPWGLMHGGLYMKGSGPIIAANWTDQNGLPIFPPIFVTYELTMVTTPSSGPSEIAMRLSAPTDLVTTFPDALIGWGGIRTFMDLPASLLGLPDINQSLDLNSLLGYETIPLFGGPAGPPLEPVDVYFFPVDSFFDVFVGETFNVGPEFESLLYAQVWFDPDGLLGQEEPFQVGQFWNLNSQSPEPSTATCLLALLAGLSLAGRRRRQ